MRAANIFLVGDYFPEPAERPRAIAIYMLAGPLSALVSFILGGWLNELFGWRVTFFVMGIPGLLLAILVKLTITEPRMHASAARDAKASMPRMGEVLSVLWHQRSFRHLCIGPGIALFDGIWIGPLVRGIHDAQPCHGDGRIGYLVRTDCRHLRHSRHSAGWIRDGALVCEQ